MCTHLSSPKICRSDSSLRKFAYTRMYIQLKSHIIHYRSMHRATFSRLYYITYLVEFIDLDDRFGRYADDGRQSAFRAVTCVYRSDNRRTFGILSGDEKPVLSSLGYWCLTRVATTWKNQVHTLLGTGCRLVHMYIHSIIHCMPIMRRHFPRNHRGVLL